MYISDGCGLLRDGGCANWHTHLVPGTSRMKYATVAFCRQTCKLFDGCEFFIHGKPTSTEEDECSFLKSGSDKTCIPDKNETWAFYSINECQSTGGMCKINKLAN